MHTTHIIIGSSAAGLSAATTLSRLDPQARIICISDEPEQPYNKCFLVDYVAADRSRQELFTLRAALAEHPHFTLLLGTSVTTIDPIGMTVTLGDGQRLSYDTLFMGMGGSPFIPAVPGISLSGVFTFYTLADIDKIMVYTAQRAVCKAVVVGAGLSGLECANALHARGIAVTMIERGDHILPHHTDRGGSDFIRKAAHQSGVAIMTNAQAHELIGQDGSIAGVLLADETLVPADLVIFTVGMRPHTGLAQRAGIALHGHHVAVDNRLQTNIPTIFAGGDLVAAPCSLTGALVPSTTWPDAVLQGSVAAYGMVGQTRLYPGVVGNTASHFFGFTIAACGRLQVSAERQSVVVASERAYSVFELEQGVLKAYSLIGASPTAAMSCRRALLTQQPISEQELRSL